MVNCLQALRHLRVGFRDYPEDMKSLLEEETERKYIFYLCLHVFSIYNDMVHIHNTTCAHLSYSGNTEKTRPQSGAGDHYQFRWRVRYVKIHAHAYKFCICIYALKQIFVPVFIDCTSCNSKEGMCSELAARCSRGWTEQRITRTTALSALSARSSSVSFRRNGKHSSNTPSK